jgi:hypothetical protein
MDLANTRKGQQSVKEIRHSRIFPKTNYDWMQANEG